MADAPDPILVVGAGIAGMAAAIEAAAGGRSVLVVERDTGIGGNARWARGFDIEGDSVEALRRSDPEGDPVLQQMLVEGFLPSISWLREIGVGLVEAEPGRYNYSGGWGDGGALAFAALGRRLSALGGRIQTEAAFRRLLRDAAGTVNGVELKMAGIRREIRASAVILATGSFGRSAKLKGRYIGSDTASGGYFGTVHHEGEGVEAAVAAGAAVSSGISVPTGACLFAPPFEPPDGSFHMGLTGLVSASPVPATIQAVLIRPPAGTTPSLLLNLAGARYVDETGTYTLLGLRTGRQPGGIGFCIFDRRVGEQEAAVLHHAREHGAPIFEAPTIAALASRLAEWRSPAGQGIDAARMVETLAAHNRAAAGGQGPNLTPPSMMPAIDQPIFYAVPVVYGICDTVGGLAVDPAMRVLDQRGRPIAGLYVAGADAGQPYSIEHGGLAWGLISGRVAGSSAAMNGAIRHQQ